MASWTARRPPESTASAIYAPGGKDERYERAWDSPLSWAGGVDVQDLCVSAILHDVS